jgi:hypothetical protein
MKPGGLESEDCHAGGNKIRTPLKKLDIVVNSITNISWGL